MTEYPDLFAALAAPFEKHEEKDRPAPGGRKLTYITARTAMNRLDAVLGPENWWDEYVPGDQSVMCRLSILLPNGRTVTKMDAGGYAGMADQGDDDKSGFSDAFKRAAAKFGVARYLYKDGVPNYGQGVASSDNHAPAPRDNAPSARREERNDRPAQDRPAQGDVPHQPRSLKGLFPWIKEVEEKLEMVIVPKMNAWSKVNKFPKSMSDWSDQERQACVEFVQGLMDDRDNDPNQDAENHSQDALPAPKPHQLPKPTGPLNIDDADAMKAHKRRIVDNVKILVKASGEPVDQKHCLERITYHAEFECGVQGMVNLRDCRDAPLIAQLDEFLQKEVEALGSVVNGGGF